MTSNKPRAANPLQVWEHLLSKPAKRHGSLTMQLVASLIDAIDTKQIPEGVRLPSSRAIAESLGIGRNTAIAAVNALVEQGYLIARDRSGIFVASSSVAPRMRSSCEPIEGFDWKTRLQLSDKPDQPYERSEPEPFAFNFKYGQFDPSTFPTNHWRQCERSASGVTEIAEWGRDAFDRDDFSLVESLRRHVLPNHGIWAEPEEILVTLGGQEGRYLVAQLLSKNGVTIGYEDPGLPDIKAILETTASHQVALPVDSDGVRLSAELKQCDVAFVMPGHHCPTTAVMSPARREALLELAKRRDMILVEDTYETELLSYGRTAPSVKSIDTEGRVIHIGSLSKSVAPGLRVGFVVASPLVIQELRSIRRLVHRHPPGNIQRALAMFIDRGYYHSYIRQVSKTSLKRATIFAQSVSRWLPSARVSHCDGAASFWLELPAEINASLLCAEMATHSVLIESGERFFFGEPRKNYLRMAVSQIPTEKIEPGIEKIARALRRA